MVENITEYTKEILKDYIVFTTKKTRLITFISVAVILICAVIELLFKEYIMSGIFLALALFFFISNLNIVKFAVKKSTSMPQIKNIYEFYPDKLNITTYSNNQEISKNTLALTTIFKVEENNNCLYLYLNKSQALIVNVNNFKDVNDKEVVKRYIQIQKNNG
ncbi:MAG: hypothetical protein E7359_00290 [Clostridiales bacterium]|nr:hypothetical protein [Clostridiales bacterium]